MCCKHILSPVLILSVMLQRIAHVIIARGNLASGPDVVTCTIYIYSTILVVIYILPFDSCRLYSSSNEMIHTSVIE